MLAGFVAGERSFKRALSAAPVVTPS
jgi:hypothetical protein